MKSNRMIPYVTLDSNNTVKVTEIRETSFQKKMFAKFLKGEAAYVCCTMIEFLNLFRVLRHTNICMFNMNYEFEKIPASFSLESDDIADYREYFPKEMSYITDRIRGSNSNCAVVYLVPQDIIGSYNISPGFLTSVSEILGNGQLSGIMRMEFALGDVMNCTCVKRNSLNWADDERVFDHKDRNILMNSGTARLGDYTATFIKECPLSEGVRPIVDPDQLFYLVKPQFDRIRVSSIASLITEQLHYHLKVKEIIKQTMSDVLDDVTEFVLNSEYQYADPNDVLMKAQAIIAWLINPKTNVNCIYFKEGGYEYAEKLSSIAMLCNVVIPPDTNKKTIGVFTDTQGMIQTVESEGESGDCIPVYDCEKAIDVIYHVIKEDYLVIDGRHFAAACHYPYIDNVPAIFWNGNMF